MEPYRLGRRLRELCEASLKVNPRVVTGLPTTFYKKVGILLGFRGDCCVKMIWAFWTDTKLLANTINRIVKMIPKR